MNEKSTHMTYPTRPEPCADPSSSKRWSSSQKQDSLRDYDEKEAGKWTSMSSTEDETSHPAYSADYKKNVLSAEIPGKADRASTDRRSRDKRMPEMAERARIGSARSSPRRLRSTESFEREDIDEEYEEQKLQQKAFRLLLLFSGPLCLISFGVTAYAIVAIVLAILATPLRLCTSRPSSKDHLLSLLTPGINLLLRCIYAPAADGSSSSLAFLILVSLLSPLLAGGMAIWAWIVAMYWFLAVIVGNPDGLDEKNDGRELVLSTRRWWLQWLRLAIRDD